MSASSTRRSLSPNLRARLTEQREAIETTTVGELQQLNTNLRAAATHEQSITESAMVKSSRSLEAGVGRDLEDGAAVLSGAVRGLDLGLGGDRLRVGVADRELPGGASHGQGQHRGPSGVRAGDRAEERGREISGFERGAVPAATARQQSVLQPGTRAGSWICRSSEGGGDL